MLEELAGADVAKFAGGSSLLTAGLMWKPKACHHSASPIRELWNPSLSQTAC